MLTRDVQAEIETVKKYTGILVSDKCWCGEYKRPRMAFCYRGCWSRLPGKLRRALYRNIGDGFETAYEESVALLQVMRGIVAG